MVYESRRLPIDIVSRVLSIFSLIVALGAIALLLSYFRFKENRADLQTTFEQHLAANAHEYQEARAELEQKYQTALDEHEQSIKTWNAQLSTVVDGFQDEAKALLVRIDDDDRMSRTERRVAFRAALDDLETRIATIGGPSQGASLAESEMDVNDSDSTDHGDPADLVPEIREDDDEAPVATNAVAVLRIVPSSLRPGSDQVTLVVIENASDKPASINRARFRPASRFPLTADPDAVQPATRVAFHPGDNTSDNPGYHGVYDHVFDSPLVVPPGQRTTLRFTITDPQHNGWGFAGKLVIDYNDHDMLVVNAARVIFTP